MDEEKQKPGYIWDPVHHRCSENIAPNTVECANDEIMSALQQNKDWDFDKPDLIHFFLEQC